MEELIIQNGTKLFVIEELGQLVFVAESFEEHVEVGSILENLVQDIDYVLHLDFAGLVRVSAEGDEGVQVVDVVFLLLFLLLLEEDFEEVFEGNPTLVFQLHFRQQVEEFSVRGVVSHRLYELAQLPAVYLAVVVCVYLLEEI